MHVVVEPHIDDLMTSATLAAAKLILEIPDKNQVDSLYTLVQGSSSSWSLPLSSMTLYSPNNSVYRLTVSDSGVLSAVLV